MNIKKIVNIISYHSRTRKYNTTNKSSPFFGKTRTVRGACMCIVELVNGKKETRHMILPKEILNN